MCDLYVSKSELHGRGVFAGRPFVDGDIIEVCEVLRVPAAELEHLDRTVLYNYYFTWDGDAGLALGFGSLYNHSYRPNATYTHMEQDDQLVVRAISHIAPDDEITFNYNGKPGIADPLWFREVRGPRPEPAVDGDS